MMQDITEEIKCYSCNSMLKSRDHPYYCTVLRLILRSEDDMKKYQSLCDVERWPSFHELMNEQT